MQSDTAQQVGQTVDEYSIDDPQLQTFLLRSGRLTQEQLDTALQARQHTGHPLWRTLLNLGLLTPQEMIEIVKTQGPPGQAQPLHDESIESPEPGRDLVLQRSFPSDSGKMQAISESYLNSYFVS
jgi:hypothetical protein